MIGCGDAYSGGGVDQAGRLHSRHVGGCIVKHDSDASRGRLELLIHHVSLPSIKLDTSFSQHALLGLAAMLTTATALMGSWGPRPEVPLMLLQLLRQIYMYRICAPSFVSGTTTCQRARFKRAIPATRSLLYSTRRFFLTD